MRVVEVEPGSVESLAAAIAGFGPLYALLDAARDRAILGHVERSGEVFESLYAGGRARQLADVAPYLAQISGRSPLLGVLAREAWGRSWGILLAAHAPLAEVRRHLRRFLTVEIEGGEAVAFRFYDPRVLRPFLASATEEEARAFFGPITTFLVEGSPRAPCTQLLCFERIGPAAPAPRPPWDLPRIRAEQLAVLSRRPGRG